MTAVAIPNDAVVVFDIDDTLYLERCYVRSGFNAVGTYLAATEGLQGVAELLWHGFGRGVRGDAFDRVLTACGLTPNPDLVARLVEVYRTHIPAIDLAPDAQRMLDRLRGRRVAAITDGPAVGQRAKAAALGLEGVIQPIIYTAELGEGCGKPHPLPFEKIEVELGIDPQRLWYLADNPAKDFAAPRERGWSGVRVRRPASLHRDLPTPLGIPEVATLDALWIDAAPEPIGASRVSTAARRAATHVGGREWRQP